MSLIETNDKAAIPSYGLIKWLVSEVRRIGRKLDGAIGFAVNDRESLAVGSSRGSARVQSLGTEVIFIITNSESIEDSQQWKYTVQILSKSSNSDDVLGMFPMPDVEIEAYNTWEILDNAGYQNGAVTGLFSIPLDARLSGWWGYFEGKAIIIFAERNEPRCDVIES